MSTSSIAQLNVGLPREYGIGETVPETSEAVSPLTGPWTTGIFKLPVAGPVWLARLGLAGDGQADLAVHGGPDKAVCAYAAGHYEDWRRTPGLERFVYGAFGENFTIAGLDEDSVCIGDIWTVGEATVQVSQPRQPCWKLARRWNAESLPHRVRQTGRTGWYFRVTAEGHVANGDRLSLIDRPHPEWTVAAANRVMHDRAGDTAALTAVAELSDNWRQTLLKRLAVTDQSI